MRDEVLPLVLHDLRSPLGAISMTASFLLDVRLPEEQRRNYLRIIQRAAGRMNRLIQNLEDVTVLKSGGTLPIAPKLQRLGGILEEACAINDVLAREKSIELKCELSGDMPPVLVDYDRLVQALSNLLESAIQSTPIGGQVVMRAERADDKVVVSVTDTGPEVPSDEVATIFDPYRLSKRYARPSASFGLMIGKTIVEAHGGRMWVESAPTGTAFFLALTA
jgi:signal transduction histidine kinase